jgi:deoxyribodipyrimidine photo-lyase
MDYGIFIFRRDYRLYDNIGLNKLSEVTKHISPIFIFDPKQIDRNNNPYFSDNCVQFMIESLLELDEELKNKHNSGLSFMHGNPTDVLTKIHKKRPFKYLAFNMDVTP